MLVPPFLFLALLIQPAEIPVLKADLGACTADFTVTDATGAPVYSATIHARIRYGVMGVKRMDVEIGTNSDGKARFEGLPAKARLIAYDVSKDAKSAAVSQKVPKQCNSSFAPVLK